MLADPNRLHSKVQPSENETKANLYGNLLEVFTYMASYQSCWFEPCDQLKGKFPVAHSGLCGSSDDKNRDSFHFPSKFLLLNER